MSAVETCDRILALVKSSNLNFFLNETPYSAYLTIRKSFAQKYSDTAVNASSENETTTALNSQIDDLKQQLEDKTRESLKKSEDLQKITANYTISQENTKILEEKIDKIEGDFLDLLKKQKEELTEQIDKIKILEDLNYNLNHKITSNNSSETKMSKEDICDDYEANLDSEEKPEYEVETNNNFEMLTKQESFTDKAEKSAAFKEKKVKSDAPEVKQIEKKIEVDGTNWKGFFQDFLEKFGDQVKDMLDRKHNTLQISMRDIRRFNPFLADFVFKEKVNKFSDMCLVLKTIIVDHHLGDSDQDFYLSFKRK